MRMLVRAVIGGLLIVAVAGCGGTSEATPTPVATAKMAGCQYKFDATVREGPSVGTSLRGTLVLVQAKADSPGEFIGAVVPPGTEATGTGFVPVTAQVNDKNVTLTFTLADGGKITGSGTTETAVGECRGTMDGSFSGPQATDKGDWLGGTTTGRICTEAVGRALGVDMCTPFLACCK